MSPRAKCGERKNTKDKESKAKEHNALSLVNVTSLVVRFKLSGFDSFCLKDYTLGQHQSSKNVCEATNLALCLCSSLSIIITSRVYFMSPSSASR